MLGGWRAGPLGPVDTRARRTVAVSQDRRTRPLKGRMTSQYAPNARRAEGDVSHTRVSVDSRPSATRKFTAILAQPGSSNASNPAADPTRRMPPVGDQGRPMPA